MAGGVNCLPTMSVTSSLFANLFLKLPNGSMCILHQETNMFLKIDFEIEILQKYYTCSISIVNAGANFPQRGIIMFGAHT